MYYRDERTMSSHYNQREDSPVADDIPMSPKSLRRAEFTIKQIQNGVMGRARSTLHSLGDVWKPKISAGHSDSNRRPTSLPLNQRTLDFFMAWSRHKKTSDGNRTKAENNATEPLDPTTKHSTNDKNYRYFGYANLFNNNTSAKQVVGDGTKHPTPISPIAIKKASGKNKASMENHTSHHMNMLDKNHNIKTNKSSALSKMHGKNISRTTQHKSLEFDDLLARDDETYENWGRSLTMNNAMRRSYDDNINNLNCDGHTDDIFKEKRRRNISLNENLLDGKGFTDRPTDRPIDAEKGVGKRKESVVKARLRLKKITANDDILLNQTVTKRPGILFRHYSVEPNSNSMRNGNERCTSPIIFTNNDRTPNFNVRQKELARKRISFREPIISDKNTGIRSNALDRAQRFLDMYERREPKHILADMKARAEEEDKVLLQ